MGTSNQRRREEKQRRRNKRREERSYYGSSCGPGAGWREQVPVRQLIQAVAEAVALQKPDAAVLVAELDALPGVLPPLREMIDRNWADAQTRGWSPELGRHAIRRLGASYAAWFDQPQVADVPTGIELLAWLITLPPLPGKSAAPLDPDDARMLDRVRALLAKAESTEYAEEAETLTAKAQELISRHSLHHALEHARRRELPGARHILLGDPYAAAKALLVDVIATANRCRAVHLREQGLATVLGFESDLYATEMLFTSLLVQATKAMTATGTAPGQRQPSYRRSFLVAYSTRIGERLDTAAARAVDDVADDRLLPVLAARHTAVDDAVDEAFPSLVTDSVRVTNRHGWASGRAAADLADLAAFEKVR